MAETIVPIRSEADIVEARRRGREAATAVQLSPTDHTLLATAISEVARNILVYAKTGEVVISTATTEGRRGVVVVARDDGPGIEDVARALEDGFTSGGGLGLGLPGARRLVDEFQIDSGPGRGTRVTMKKWAK